MIDFNHDITLILVAFIVGIATGSFVTMASYRIPLGMDIVFRPSHCPACKTRLSTLDLFPVLSWLFQKGTCRHCKASIPVRYPAIELTVGCIYACIAYRYGISWDTAILFLLALWLMILIVTDLEQFIIPDSMQVAVLLTGIVWRLHHYNDPEDILLGAAVGLGLGLLLHYGFLYLRKKDGLGWGDVKFLGAAGAWLTLSSFVSFLFFAGVIGTVFGLLWKLRKEGEIFPFGPALAVSLFINVLWPDMLQRWVS